MKILNIYILVIISCIVVACEKKEESLCDYERLYPEIPEVQFTVNGNNFVQNVSSSSFPNDEYDFEKIYVENPSNGGVYNIDLYFTFIEFIENETCDAEYEHRIVINVNVDQGINETKTYPVNLLGTPATASYVFERETQKLPSGNSTITISKYIPENDLEGTFSIQFDDVETTGTFKLDLTKTY